MTARRPALSVMRTVKKAHAWPHLGVDPRVLAYPVLLLDGS